MWSVFDPRHLHQNVLQVLDHKATFARFRDTMSSLVLFAAFLLKDCFIRKVSPILPH